MSVFTPISNPVNVLIRELPIRVQCEEAPYYVLSNDSVEIELSVDERYPDDDVIYLESIESKDRGRGNASAFLREFLNRCDRDKIIVRLHVTPYGKIGLSFEELLAWYKRHGFEQDGSYHRSLCRYPKTLAA